MNVEELLELMEETLEEGAAVPFASSRRIVDVDRMRDIIDEVRNNLPDEIHDSKKIVADREQIIKGAKAESENIIKQAEERARGLVSEQEIVKRAQQRAVEILTAAQREQKPGEHQPHRAEGDEIPCSLQADHLCRCKHIYCNAEGARRPRTTFGSGG